MHSKKLHTNMHDLYAESTRLLPTRSVGITMTQNSKKEKLSSSKKKSDSVVYAASRFPNASLHFKLSF